MEWTQNSDEVVVAMGTHKHGNNVLITCDVNVAFHLRKYASNRNDKLI